MRAIRDSVWPAYALVIAVAAYSYWSGGEQDKKRVQGQVESRAVVARESCVQQNQLAAAVNGQNIYIQGLIVGGAKASRIFEPLYRRYDAPPYMRRVAQAEDQALGLKRLQVPIADCEARVKKIRASRPD